MRMSLNRRAGGFLGSLLSFLLIAFSGCEGDSVDCLVSLRVTVDAVTRAGRPFQNAEVRLIDSQLFKWWSLESRKIPVCTTNASGECSALVRYQYGYTRWHWEKNKDPNDSLRNRFTFEVWKDGQLQAAKKVSAISAKQLQGYSNLRVSVRQE
jgi:hypothetical protein